MLTRDHPIWKHLHRGVSAFLALSLLLCDPVWASGAAEALGHLHSASLSQRSPTEFSEVLNSEALNGRQAAAWRNLFSGSPGITLARTAAVVAVAAGIVGGALYGSHSSYASLSTLIAPFYHTAQASFHALMEPRNGFALLIGAIYIPVAWTRRVFIKTTAKTLVGGALLASPAGVLAQSAMTVSIENPALPSQEEFLGAHLKELDPEKISQLTYEDIAGMVLDGNKELLIQQLDVQEAYHEYLAACAQDKTLVIGSERLHQQEFGFGPGIFTKSDELLAFSEAEIINPDKSIESAYGKGGVRGWIALFLGGATRIPHSELEKTRLRRLQAALKVHVAYTRYLKVAAEKIARAQTLYWQILQQDLLMDRLALVMNYEDRGGQIAKPLTQKRNAGREGVGVHVANEKSFALQLSEVQKTRDRATAQFLGLVMVPPKSHQDPLASSYVTALRRMEEGKIRLSQPALQIRPEDAELIETLTGEKLPTPQEFRKVVGAAAEKIMPTDEDIHAAEIRKYGGHSEPGDAFFLKRTEALRQLRDGEVIIPSFLDESIAPLWDAFIPSPKGETPLERPAAPHLANPSTDLKEIMQSPPDRALAPSLQESVLRLDRMWLEVAVDLLEEGKKTEVSIGERDNLNILKPWFGILDFFQVTLPTDRTRTDLLIKAVKDRIREINSQLGEEDDAHDQNAVLNPEKEFAGTEKLQVLINSEEARIDAETISRDVDAIAKDLIEQAQEATEAFQQKPNKSSDPLPHLLTVRSDRYQILEQKLLGLKVRASREVFTPVYQNDIGALIGKKFADNFPPLAQWLSGHPPASLMQRPTPLKKPGFWRRILGQSIPSLNSSVKGLGVFAILHLARLLDRSISGGHPVLSQGLVSDGGGYTQYLSYVSEFFKPGHHFVLVDWLLQHGFQGQNWMHWLPSLAIFLFAFYPLFWASSYDRKPAWFKALFGPAIGLGVFRFWQVWPGVGFIWAVTAAVIGLWSDPFFRKKGSDGSLASIGFSRRNFLARLPTVLAGTFLGAEIIADWIKYGTEAKHRLVERPKEATIGDTTLAGFEYSRPEVTYTAPKGMVGVIASVDKERTSVSAGQYVIVWEGLGEDVISRLKEINQFLVEKEITTYQTEEGEEKNLLILTDAVDDLHPDAARAEKLKSAIVRIRAYDRSEVDTQVEKAIADFVEAKLAYQEAVTHREDSQNESPEEQPRRRQMLAQVRYIQSLLQQRLAGDIKAVQDFHIYWGEQQAHKNKEISENDSITLFQRTYQGGETEGLARLIITPPPEIPVALQTHLNNPDAVVIFDKSGPDGTGPIEIPLADIKDLSKLGSEDATWTQSPQDHPHFGPRGFEQVPLALVVKWPGVLPAVAPQLHLRGVFLKGSHKSLVVPLDKNQYLGLTRLDERDSFAPLAYDPKFVAAVNEQSKALSWLKQQMNAQIEETQSHLRQANVGSTKKLADEEDKRLQVLQEILAKLELPMSQVKGKLAEFQTPGFNPAIEVVPQIKDDELYFALDTVRFEGNPLEKTVLVHQDKGSTVMVARIPLTIHVKAWALEPELKQVGSLQVTIPETNQSVTLGATPDSNVPLMTPYKLETGGFLMELKDPDVIRQFLPSGRVLSQSVVLYSLPSAVITQATPDPSIRFVKRVAAVLLFPGSLLAQNGPGISKLGWEIILGALPIVFILNYLFPIFRIIGWPFRLIYLEIAKSARKGLLNLGLRLPFWIRLESLLEYAADFTVKENKLASRRETVYSEQQDHSSSASYRFRQTKQLAKRIKGTFLKYETIWKKGDSRTFLARFDLRTLGLRTTYRYLKSFFVNEMSYTVPEMLHKQSINGGITSGMSHLLHRDYVLYRYGKAKAESKVSHGNTGLFYAIILFFILLAQPPLLTFLWEFLQNLSAGFLFLQWIGNPTWGQSPIAQFVLAYFVPFLLIVTGISFTYNFFLKGVAEPRWLWEYALNDWAMRLLVKGRKLPGQYKEGTGRTYEKVLKSYYPKNKITSWKGEVTNVLEDDDERQFKEDLIDFAVPLMEALAHSFDDADPNLQDALVESLEDYSWRVRPTSLDQQFLDLGEWPDEQELVEVFTTTAIDRQLVIRAELNRPYNPGLNDEERHKLKSELEDLQTQVQQIVQGIQPDRQRLLQIARRIVTKEKMLDPKRAFPALLALVMHDMTAALPIQPNDDATKAIIKNLEERTNTMAPEVHDGFRRYRRLSQMLALIHEVWVLFVDQKGEPWLKEKVKQFFFEMLSENDIESLEEMLREGGKLENYTPPKNQRLRAQRALELFLDWHGEDNIFKKEVLSILVRRLMKNKPDEAVNKLLNNLNPRWKEQPQQWWNDRFMSDPFDKDHVYTTALDLMRLYSSASRILERLSHSRYPAYGHRDIIRVGESLLNRREPFFDFAELARLTRGDIVILNFTPASEEFMDHLRTQKASRLGNDVAKRVRILSVEQTQRYLKRLARELPHVEPERRPIIMSVAEPWIWKELSHLPALRDYLWIPYAAESHMVANFRLLPLEEQERIIQATEQDSSPAAEERKTQLREALAWHDEQLVASGLGRAVVNNLGNNGANISPFVIPGKPTVLTILAEAGEAPVGMPGTELKDIFSQVKAAMRAMEAAHRPPLPEEPFQRTIIARLMNYLTHLLSNFGRHVPEHPNRYSRKLFAAA